MKAVIFARVSSREQEETGYSLDSQEKFLHQYAARQGFEVVRVFRVTESASGQTVRRHYSEMFAYLEKERIPIVLCEKTDRLTRNAKDSVSVSDWVEQDSKRAIHLVKENIIIDKENKAHEKLMWDIKASVARFYTNNLSEEVKKGQKEKVEQGHLPTKPPLGYMTVGEKGRKVHKIDNEKAHYIREMFELYATGNHTTRGLVSEMFKRGLRTRAGRKLGKSCLHKLLSNPFYYGEFYWKDELHKGAHEPLVSMELFNLVQARLNRPVASLYYTKHLPVFKGKISCGACGHTITWENQKGHWYGGCKSCDAKQGDTRYIRQEKIEAQVLEKLVSVAPKSERILKILEKALKESHSQEVEVRESKIKALQQIIDRSKRRVDAMYVDKLDELISVDEFAARSRVLNAEKEDALRELKKLEENSSHYYRAGIGIHELALRAKEIYLSPKALTEDRRNLLSYAFKGLILKNGLLDMEYTPGFEFLSKWVPALNDEFEPQKTVANKRQKASSDASRPTLLRE